MFEYSKLETHQIQPEKESFQLLDLAHDLISNYQVIADCEKINLSLQMTEGNLPLVFSDISLVERAIQNLMDNTIKFTPEGGKIRFQVAADESNVTINISDPEPEIPEG